MSGWYWTKGERTEGLANRQVTLSRTEVRLPDGVMATGLRQCASMKRVSPACMEPVRVCDVSMNGREVSGQMVVDDEWIYPCAGRAVRGIRFGEHVLREVEGIQDVSVVIDSATKVGDERPIGLALTSFWWHRPQRGVGWDASLGKGSCWATLHAELR